MFNSTRYQNVVPHYFRVIASVITNLTPNFCLYNICSFILWTGILNPEIKISHDPRSVYFCRIKISMLKLEHADTLKSILIFPFAMYGSHVCMKTIIHFETVIKKSVLDLNRRPPNTCSHTVSDS